MYGTKCHRATRQFEERMLDSNTSDLTNDLMVSIRSTLPYIPSALSLLPLNEDSANNLTVLLPHPDPLLHKLGSTRHLPKLLMFLLPSRLRMEDQNNGRWWTTNS